MPKNKDLKRLTRARMQKTGESYTTARRQLLEKKEMAAAQPAPEEFAALAGMSDEAVKKATGCDWARWVWALDGLDAASMPHREIAQLVHDKWHVSGWWAQTVTVGYERIRGLREIGQRRDGSYETNKSKTLPVPVSQLYHAFGDEKARRDWLGEVDLEVRRQTPEKSMRVNWPDGTSVELYFTAKGDSKSQVQIQHRKLASKDAVEEMKAYWTDRLKALAESVANA